MSTTTTTGKYGTIVVSALHARANFGKLLRRVDAPMVGTVFNLAPQAVLHGRHHPYGYGYGYGYGYEPNNGNGTRSEPRLTAARPKTQ